MVDYKIGMMVQYHWGFPNDYSNVVIKEVIDNKIYFDDSTILDIEVDIDTEKDILNVLDKTQIEKSGLNNFYLSEVERLGIVNYYGIEAVPEAKPSEIIYILSDSAEAFSQEMYRLGMPESIEPPTDVGRYLTGWIQKPNTQEFAIEVATDQQVLVHPDFDATKLLELITVYTEAEKVAFISFLEGLTSTDPTALPRCLFSDLMLPSLVYYDKQWMIDNGWFK